MTQDMREENAMTEKFAAFESMPDFPEAKEFLDKLQETKGKAYTYIVLLASIMTIRHDMLNEFDQEAARNNFAALLTDLQKENGMLNRTLEILKDVKTVLSLGNDAQKEN